MSVAVDRTSARGHSGELIEHARQAGKALTYFSDERTNAFGEIGDPMETRGCLRKVQRHIIKALEHLDEAEIVGWSR